MTDPVNSPAHYNSGDIECIQAIEIATEGHSGFIAYCLGNCIKYLWRSAYKGKTLEDLKKARWYLDRAISNVEVASAESKTLAEKFDTALNELRAQVKEAETERPKQVFWDRERPETD